MTVLSALDIRFGRAGATLQRRYLAERGYLTARTNFAESGAVPYEIPKSAAARMMRYFAPENARQFRADDCADGFASSDLPGKTVRRLNAENIYYGVPDGSVQAALEDYLTLISGAVADELLSHFSVVNIRAWEMKPGAAFGPSAWHVDGSSPFLTKIMIYPNGASPAKGSFEFFDRNGVRRLLDSDQPLAVLFDSAVLLHRGVPSPTERRPAIEITLAPDFDTTSFLAFAGQNARFPHAHLRKLEEGLETASGGVPSRGSPGGGAGGVSGTKCQPVEISEMSMVQSQSSDMNAAAFNTSGKVNIGGGPNFKHEGWLNFDEFPGAAEQSVKLSEETVLPVPSGTVDIVYSSHCFEHLPEGAIERCLDEALRILRRDGLLLVKLPSYEAILEAYRNGDAAFFDLWNIGGIASTWGARQIEDNLANRASMIFCGFWNSAYGHEFGGMRKLKKKSFRRSIVPFFRDVFARITAAFSGKKTGTLADTEGASVGHAAYHGPAALPLHVVEDILSLDSPREIARTLRAHVVATEPDRTFNHQCAFSVAEFSDLLKRRGFELLTTDKARICSGYADVPGIREMYEISSYYLAKPKG